MIYICFQFLDEHRASVLQIRWNRSPTFKHVADRLTLASADTSGQILVWNVKTVKNDKCHHFKRKNV